MKHLILPFIITAICLSACSDENKTDVTSMLGVYYGVHPSVEMKNPDGTVTTIPSFDFSIEILKDTLIMISGDSSRTLVPYTISGEKDGVISFTATAKHDSMDVSHNFEFAVVSRILTMKGFNGGEDILLRTWTDLMKAKVDEFAVVSLKADISHLTDKEKQLISLLFDVAQIMDDLFWIQSVGDKEAFLSGISDANSKRFAEINYGPWEQLNDNKPFISGFGSKPDVGTFYPEDMTKEEFTAWDSKEKESWYTIIKRDESGKLITVPYSEYYGEKLKQASELLNRAAELAEDPGMKKYLELRAEALLTNDYFASDMAWMDMKTSKIDFVVGPIESYNDNLFHLKASFESFILVKDLEWSKKLEKFVALLPEIQQSLPVGSEYKKEVPGKDSDLGVYEAIYYAGDCNAGSKTIAINLPNDKEVNAKKGSRKLQLKNSMRAKFEKILVPISNILIAENQRKNINFDAFFENVMFHEVAHGLGISKTITGKGLVSTAMQDANTGLEEAKADILGLYIVTKLFEKGELSGHELLDNYVTFMAGIFRSVRFGAASSHGKANMIEFNYFQDTQAFTRDEKTGTYSVNFEKMKEAVNSLGAKILIIQGNGDYSAAKALLAELGIVRPTLQSDLARIAKAGIPRDIVFEQGKSVMGL